VVRSQIATLTFAPSFSHNLCFKYPNGSCKPILNIYVSRTFQWYKELFSPMSFNPWNMSLKIPKSIGTLTHKVGVHLGVWGFIPSHFPTLLRAWNVTPELHFWPALLQALALVMSPRWGLQHTLCFSIGTTSKCHFSPRLPGGSPKIGTLPIPKPWMLISFSNKIYIENAREIFYNLLKYYSNDV
jgi:hypothetical protein